MGYCESYAAYILEEKEQVLLSLKLLWRKTTTRKCLLLFFCQQGGDGKLWYRRRTCLIKHFWYQSIKEAFGYSAHPQHSLMCCRLLPNSNICTYLRVLLSPCPVTILLKSSSWLPTSLGTLVWFLWYSVQRTVDTYPSVTLVWNEVALGICALELRSIPKFSSSEGSWRPL